MKVIGYIVTLIGSMALTSIWRGYVLSVLWAWFIVEIFNLPLLNIPVAIGISLIVSFLTFQLRNDDDSEFDTKLIIKGLSVGLSMPAFYLLIGWVVTWFM